RRDDWRRTRAERRERSSHDRDCLDERARLAGAARVPAPLPWSHAPLRLYHLAVGRGRCGARAGPLAWHRLSAVEDARESDLSGIEPPWLREWDAQNGNEEA